MISAASAAVVIFGTVSLAQNLFDGAPLDTPILILTGLALSVFLSIFVFAAIILKKRDSFLHHMWKTFYFSFGAPASPSYHQNDELRHIKNRLKLAWYSHRSIPKKVKFIGEGGSISIRDLETFMDFLMSHMRQVSAKTANSYGYALNLKELDRGIVHATMEPLNEDFKKKEATWQFIRLFRAEVAWDFVDLGSVIEGFDANNRMSFRVVARQSYRESTLRGFENALEAFFNTSFSVEQRANQIYVTEVDREEKLETIETVRYVTRAWNEAAKRTDAYAFREPEVRINKKSARTTFDISFDRQEDIDNDTFKEIETIMKHYLAKKFGGQWLIENHLMESGRVIIKQYDENLGY